MLTTRQLKPWHKSDADLPAHFSACRFPASTPAASSRKLASLMPLPDVIEIVPLAGPVTAEITVPGSKSITNRALVLAALAGGETTLHGALWSEDTQVMADCLQDLGFMVNIAPDPHETCNRTITVYGQGGRVPRGGTAAQPLDLFVGNAGTAARFLAALVCLGGGVYRLHGVPRMHERPQAALFQALRQLGYRVESPNDRLPALVHGAGPKPGAACAVSIAESSQFASALLLGAKAGGWKVEVTGENAEESPYVAMTTELIKVFPHQGGSFRIEPDASSGSYFWAAGKGVIGPEKMEFSSQFGVDVPTTNLAPIRVAHWPDSGWQVDQRFPEVLRNNPALGFGLATRLGAAIDDATLKAVAASLESPVISRLRDLGDSIMTAVVLAPWSIKPARFTELGRLRVQECERVVALRTELTKCGAKVVEEGDTLTVHPSPLHGAEIETYNDHRMAMCFAILGLKVPGIKIKNPACVKKTFPNFFQKLTAAPPHGLGAEIRDARTGRRLAGEELFAQ
jgi:3-phosphoshikimate 1-carboxyvinyltransferase